jgi:hypothetical protein
MANLNNSEPTTTPRTNRMITHYININVITHSGKHESLGAIPVYDGGTKNQRTLIAKQEAGVDISNLFGLAIDLRANSKSETLADTDDWVTVNITEAN